MATKTLAQLVEEIKALTPEENRERARGVAKAYYKFVTGRRQKADLRRVRKART
ncbi:MAG: hypothetical protein PXY39_07875 [archaeon]|nr:hypothetical protein [archaeon]